jgi:hypothetical protein
LESMNWNACCIYVDGVGGCIDVDGEIRKLNELKPKCELGVEKCYPSGRKRCNTVSLVGSTEVSSWEVAGLILVSVCCQKG